MKIVGHLKKNVKWNWYIHMDPLGAPNKHKQHIEKRYLKEMKEIFSEDVYQKSEESYCYQSWNYPAKHAIRERYLITKVPVMKMQMKLIGWTPCRSTYAYRWETSNGSVVETAAQESFDIVTKIISGEILNKDGWISEFITVDKKGNELFYRLAKPEEWEPLSE